jgi:protein TonB
VNKKKAFLSASAILYGGSIVLHVGLAIGISLLPKQKKSDIVAISMAGGKKKGDKKTDKPEPPKPMVEPPKPAAAKTQAAPKPASAPPPPEQQPQINAPPPAPGMENLLDLGMMGNGGSGNGMALGARGPNAPAPTATATATTKKTETLAPTVDKCAEPTTKPRRKGGPQPSYTQNARQAEIEGQVRVQVTVDESGHVIAAQIANGLGYGLDEAALAAAKRWTFDPATKCGNPVVGATTLLFGFHLDR